MHVLIAGLLFLGTHLGMASSKPRAALVGKVGEQGFLGIYSLISLATFGYLLWAYGEAAQDQYLWLPSEAAYWLTKAVMVVACIFAVGAFTVKNPSQIGQSVATEGDLATGMLRITRHPFMWAVLLWSASHLVANGDTASVMLFLTFLALAGVGAWHIDRKKARTMGEDWTRFTAVTSNIPFVAIAGGRNKLAMGELVTPLTLGAVLYAVLYFLHEWVSGVALS